MATDHRRTDAEPAQGILLDDPGFLKGIVQKVVQDLFGITSRRWTLCRYATAASSIVAAS